jgi:hypothetical protein
MGADIAAQSERITARNEERKQRTRMNRAVIAKGNVPAELASSADRLSPDTVSALDKFLAVPETEEQT